ncbi:MAG: hypothetical protein Q4E76_07130 [Tissierellia bacterium]|nr:hypothetical protein [Tissierellia bacterium]
MPKLLLILSPLILPGLTALFYRHFSRRHRPRALSSALYYSYILWLLSLLLIPTRSLSTMGLHLGVDPEVLDWNLNLIPLRTISRYSHHVLGLHYFTNIWGNILMTVPLGLLAALKNPREGFGVYPKNWT